MCLCQWLTGIRSADIQRPQRYFWRLQLFGELRSARGHSCGRQYWSPPGRVMTPTVCNCSKYATPTPSPSPSDSPKLNTPPSNWPPPQLERNAALGQPHFVTAAPYPVILDPFYYCHSHPCHLHLQSWSSAERREGTGSVWIFLFSPSTNFLPI